MQGNAFVLEQALPELDSVAASNTTYPSTQLKFPRAHAFAFAFAEFTLFSSQQAMAAVISSSLTQEDNDPLAACSGRVS